MTKTALKNLAEGAVILLQKLFGEGIGFECREYYRNILFHLPLLATSNHCYSNSFNSR